MNETALRTSDKSKKMPDASNAQMESSGTEIDQMESSDEEEDIITVGKVAPVPKPVGILLPPMRPSRVLPKIAGAEPSEFEVVGKVKPSIAPLPECEVGGIQRTRPSVKESVSKKPLEIMRVSRADLDVEPKRIVREIPDIDVAVLRELDETEDKVPTPEVMEPEPSLNVFGDIGVDEGNWITNGSTGLPSDAQLFYIHGKEGAGFDVFKGLLTLEIMDRGRRPNPQEISLSIKKARNIKDISDDKDDYYRLIWVENSHIPDMRVPEIASEISKASNKGFLRYIVFANHEETMSINLMEIENVFAKHGSFSEIRLMQDPGDELLEVGAVFAKILQINRRDIPMQEMFSGFNKPTTIDSLWNRMWKKKESALERLGDVYLADQVNDFLPPWLWDNITRPTHSQPRRELTHSMPQNTLTNMLSHKYAKSGIAFANRHCKSSG